MLNYYARLIVAVVVVLAIAQVIPEPTNAFLILLLIGIIIGNAKAFAWMWQLIGSLG